MAMGCPFIDRFYPLETMSEQKMCLVLLAERVYGSSVFDATLLKKVILGEFLLLVDDVCMESPRL